MKKLLAAALVALAAALPIQSARAQPAVAPQVQSVGPNDLFQDVTAGFGQGQSYYASASLMGGTFGNWGAETATNYLIGGDATTNLWQRGTGATAGTGATVIYPSADRWFGWEALAGSTGFTLNQVTTAAALPTGAGYAFQMKLANSNTGTAQICMGQEIPGVNAIYLAGRTVELDFSAYAGATWTASQVNAYIIYGTHAFPADEGSADMAFGLNANSASSTTWTGQAIATSGAFPMSVSTLYRAVAVASLPATATEVGVALCWTPSGTSSGTAGTDYVSFSNIELRRAGYLAPIANATTAYALSSNNALQSNINGVVQNFIVPPFAWRPAAQEAQLQYPFYYQVNELDTAALPNGPAGYYSTTTTCLVDWPTPAPMFKSPTIQNSAITTSTFTVAQTGGTPAAGAALAGSGNSGLVIATGSAPSAPFTHVQLDFITGAKTQYAACQLLSTAAGAGNFGLNAEE